MVGTIGGATTTSATQGASNRASVSREQFLKILVTELSSQNPMDPIDNTQFLNQLVGLQSLEQTAALTDSLRTFEQFMQMSSASSLIGKKVKGVNAAGQSVEGKVSKVVLDKGQIELLVGDKKLPMSGIQEILPDAP
ncbi:MAG: hypothetical protein HYY17_09205 [Planctomycetes bacterium]|nr:hypothetical protein [Planctomycetota bacterium]